MLIAWVVRSRERRGGVGIKEIRRTGYKRKKVVKLNNTEQYLSFAEGKIARKPRETQP